MVQGAEGVDLDEDWYDTESANQMSKTKSDGYKRKKDPFDFLLKN